jgi:predicted outer membrane repeat protein
MTQSTGARGKSGGLTGCPISVLCDVRASQRLPDEFINYYRRLLLLCAGLGVSSSRVYFLLNPSSGGAIYCGECPRNASAKAKL